MLAAIDNRDPMMDVAGKRAARPDVSVVIPMRNAADTIGPLIDRILSTDGLSIEVVAVDDASTDGSAGSARLHGGSAARVIEVPSRHGAGHARNLGFSQVQGTYTLFFDADDEFHPAALSAAVRALDATRADVAFLPYRYRRSNSATHEGMNSYDQAVWTRYSTQQLRPMRLDAVPRLLGFSNYPWNKVLRSAHYAGRGLRFGESLVHNDILGHWIVLLQADAIVLVDQPLCTHVVIDGAANLTNHRGRSRLDLFSALDETYDYLQAQPALRNRYSHHYWDFALRVAGWAGERIGPDLVDEFNVLLQQHLLRMNLVDFTRIYQRRDPGLGSRLMRRALA